MAKCAGVMFIITQIYKTATNKCYCNTVTVLCFPRECSHLPSVRVIIQDKVFFAVGDPLAVHAHAHWPLHCIAEQDNVQVFLHNINYILKLKWFSQREG